MLRMVSSFAKDVRQQCNILSLLFSRFAEVTIKGIKGKIISIVKVQGEK